MEEEEVLEVEEGPRAGTETWEAVVGGPWASPAVVAGTVVAEVVVTWGVEVVTVGVVAAGAGAEMAIVGATEAAAGPLHQKLVHFSALT